MLRGYRGFIAKIAGLALITFAAYGFYSVVSWKSVALEQDAAQRTDIHRQNAEERIKWVCSSRASDTLCIEQTRQTQRENEREEQDLAAQRVTAWWTNVMGVAALIGIALSAVGIWLVKTTFDETRKANEIARMSQRPWLDAEIVVDGIAKSENGYVLRIIIHIKNLGLSPAIRLKCIIDGVFWHEVLSGDTAEISNYLPKVNDFVRRAVDRVEAAQKMLGQDGFTIFPNEKTIVHVEEEISAPSHVSFGYVGGAWLVVGLRYHFTGGEGRTLRVFNVRSFGLPCENGFDLIGDYNDTFTDTKAKIVAWETGGYAK
jgi:hypothetical protein